MIGYLKLPVEGTAAGGTSGVAVGATGKTGAVTVAGGTNGMAVGATGTMLGTIVWGPSTFKIVEDEGVCP